jgi:TolB-like protein
MARLTASRPQDPSNPTPDFVSRRAPHARNVLAAVLLLVLAGFWIPIAHAGAVKLAVLELRNDAGLSVAEMAYLTDRVRGDASQNLPSSAFLVMTRESIQELLPPGVRLVDCLSSQCEVEVGRKIGADYIVTGEILKFGDELRMNLKVHHCASSAFLGSETAGGARLADLENGVAAASSRLFAKVRADAGAGEDAEGRIGAATPESWSPPGDSATVVSFKSDPAGAVVMVDGRVLCQGTPCSRELPEGIAVVTMQRERYLPRQDVVEVARRGPPLKLDWTLEPDFGWLSVTSIPPGLPVTIDGKPAGRTPIAASELAPGTHEVRIGDPRYHERGERVVLARGEKRTVSLAPDPREGAIQVSARGADSNSVAARVLLDGVDAGTTPCTIKALIGRHAITARLDGAQWTDSVQVAERQVVTVQARLRRVAPAIPRPGIGGAAGALVRGQSLLARAVDLAGGSAAWAAIRSISVTRAETASIQGQTRELTSEIHWRIPDHYLARRKFALGAFEKGYDGTHGWNADRGSVRDQPRVGEELKRQYERSILRLFAGPGAFQVQALDELRTVDGVTCSVARVKSETTPDWLLYFAPDGSLARMEYQGEGANGGPVRTTEIYGDWRPVGHVRYPRREQTLMDGQPVMDARVTSVKLNPALADELFRKPAQ